MSTLSRKSLIIAALGLLLLMLVAPVFAGPPAAPPYSYTGSQTSHHYTFSLTLTANKSITINASCTDTSSSGIAMAGLFVSGANSAGFDCSAPISGATFVPSADGVYNFDFHVHTNDCDSGAGGYNDCYWDLNVSVTDTASTPVVVVKGAAVVLPPDNRLNWQCGDNYAVIYPSRDDVGGPDLKVYTIDAKSHGSYAFAITQADLASYVANPPAENTLVKSEGNVNLYALTNGIFQVRVGPDFEGKVWVYEFDGLPRSASKCYPLNPLQ